MLVVVTYDIADDKRRVAVSKILEDFGFRVQESVFEAQLDDARMRRLCKRVATAIDERQDSLRVDRLCKECEERVTMIGCGEQVRDESVYVI